MGAFEPSLAGRRTGEQTYSQPRRAGVILHMEITMHSQIPPQPPSMGMMQPHRGVMILVLGILGLVFGILGLVMCVIFGIVAWVMGSGDLKQMDAGAMDPSGRGLTQAGKICGMISVILNIIGIVVLVVFIIFILAAGGAAAAAGAGTGP